MYLVPNSFKVANCVPKLVPHTKANYEPSDYVLFPFSRDWSLLPSKIWKKKPIARRKAHNSLSLNHQTQSISQLMIKTTTHRRCSSPKKYFSHSTIDKSKSNLILSVNLWLYRFWSNVLDYKVGGNRKSEVNFQISFDFEISPPPCPSTKFKTSGFRTRPKWNKTCCN